ncbi:MAG TPA: metallophosphoesterase [Candidatus Angelobacter sp.]|nr:metallophosphoesterase [Candidatus Angelobacter sp.]
MSNISNVGQPTIEFLFRFRDLVAATLQEHEKIITEHRSCWWGWWKRPSEGSRMEVWTSLSSNAQAGAASGGVPVGLFDSGSGNVHRVWVTEIIPPHEDTPETTGRSEVPDGQKHLVPAYYRESPFSRAWMRIVKIERNIQFWGEYSFRDAPRLANYSQATLERFKGKIIHDAEELRGMDTTIWGIRLKLPSDLSERILLSVPALHESISDNVVRCDSDIILHLTDLHFAVGSNRHQHRWRLDSDLGRQDRTMVEAITAAIGNRKVGLVVVTGDFTFTGEKIEFDEALSALRLLLGVLNLSTDHLVVIPGNHDIRWTTTQTYSDTAEVVQAPENARAHYAWFYNELYRHQPNKHLAMGRRYLLPSGVAVEICGLNSSSLETGKNFLAGVGRISEAPFEDVANKLGWKHRKTGSMAVRVLLVHHHLALTEDLELAAGYPRGFGLALDAVRIQRLAASYGVQLAIHGHKHRAFLWRSSVFELPENTKPNYFLGDLAIIGGGSAGSTDTDANSNYFNLLTLTSNGVHLAIHRSRDGGAFELMQEWRAPASLTTGTGQLALGMWELVQTSK